MSRNLNTSSNIGVKTKSKNSKCCGNNSCLLSRLTSNNEFGHSGCILEYSNLDTLLFSPAVEVRV